ncbi:MAG: proteasome subunit alpha [Acidimicrobiia bacterium]|nr:proteasome subunit alpha [Acidimicrobiia bacterium]
MSMPMYVPPEQLMKDRAEFAKKGIALGRPIVVLEYADGVLLMGENPSGSLQKIGEIYDEIAFAGVGRFNEFESLRVAGIRYADLKGYSYGRSDVTAKGLANAYAQTLGQVFTHEVKPYEIEVIVAEIGREPDDNQIYRIQYDGTLIDLQRFGVIGGDEEDLTSRLEGDFVDGMDLASALRLGCSAIEAIAGDPIGPDGWEAAVLDRANGRRKFRRVDKDTIAAARA